MKTSIQDRDALLAVSPVALSAYARAEGWSKEEAYGDFSDIYVADGLPEIILPRTENLGDYADVVSTLHRDLRASSPMWTNSPSIATWLQLIGTLSGCGPPTAMTGLFP